MSRQEINDTRLAHSRLSGECQMRSHFGTKVDVPLNPFNSIRPDIEPEKAEWTFVKRDHPHTTKFRHREIDIDEFKPRRSDHRGSTVYKGKCSNCSFQFIWTWRKRLARSGV